MDVDQVGVVDPGDQARLPLERTRKPAQVAIRREQPGGSCPHLRFAIARLDMLFADRSLSNAGEEPRARGSFEATDLEELLAERSVGRLVVTGAQTEECIRATLHGALVRGYDATLVSDAHTTEDLREWGLPVTPEQSIAYTNAYWDWAAAPERKGSVAATSEVDFSQV